MKLLLDTHALRWFSLGDVRMPTPIRELIADSDHAVWVSSASHWEIATNISVGKYALANTFHDFFEQAVVGNGFN